MSSITPVGHASIHHWPGLHGSRIILPWIRSKYSIIFRPGHSRSISCVLVAMLQLCGDVECNPGPSSPTSNLRLRYVNIHKTVLSAHPRNCFGSFARCPRTLRNKIYYYIDMHRCTRVLACMAQGSFHHGAGQSIPSHSGQGIPVPYHASWSRCYNCLVTVECNPGRSVTPGIQHIRFRYSIIYQHS